MLIPFDMVHGRTPAKCLEHAEYCWRVAQATRNPVAAAQSWVWLFRWAGMPC